MLIAAAHAKGWVVAEGGSQAIADALVADIERHGGTIETGVRVTSADDLPPSDVLMLDVSPSIAADILGDRLPARVARSYRRFRHGPGAFKVDFAIDGDVPWTAPAARQAGTVHLGGDLDEVVANEQAVHRGAMPERPFVLVGQQYLADPTRSAGNIHPLWTYAHVPARLHGRRHRGDHRSDRTIRPRLPRADRRHGGALHDGDVGVQPELRRRRHHRRRVLADASCCSDHASRSTRTSPASRARICARRRHRRGRARTGCAAPTPPLAPWLIWDCAKKRLTRRTGFCPCSPHPVGDVHVMVLRCLDPPTNRSRACPSSDARGPSNQSGVAPTARSCTACSAHTSYISA